MAKDDYFVIVYRILKYLYACFKTGEKPDFSLFSPDALGINNGYWVNIIESMSNEGYISCVVFPSAVGGIKSVKILDIKITEKGIIFLEDNSKMKKAAEFLKSASEIIPGF